MKETFPLIKFKGRQYLLIGNLNDGGAIATPRQYTNGYLSHAYLYSSGHINRLGKTIGARQDIEIIGETEVEPSYKGFRHMFRWLFEE